jgi:hypothetical protein
MTHNGAATPATPSTHLPRTPAGDTRAKHFHAAQAGVARRVGTVVGLSRLNQVDPYPITYSLSIP